MFRATTNDGASPSGKALLFGSSMRWFESSRPSQIKNPTVYSVGFFYDFNSVDHSLVFFKSVPICFIGNEHLLMLSVNVQNLKKSYVSSSDALQLR